MGKDLATIPSYFTEGGVFSLEMPEQMEAPTARIPSEISVAGKFELLLLEWRSCGPSVLQHEKGLCSQRIKRIREIEQIPMALQVYKPDVIVVFWDGPTAALVELLHTVRRAASATDLPLVVASACVNVSMKIAALNAGADQYLTAPWKDEELAAHIQALRRLAPHSPAATRGANGLQLDLHRQKVTARTETGPRSISLSPQEFRFLHFMVENPMQVHTRADLLRQVWGRSAHVGGRTVDAHIRKLRVALAGTSCDGLIHTVYGRGYRLALDTTSLEGEPF